MAVIGAGVSGCALASGLRHNGFDGEISLWEAGRGPGGRCATRRSRVDPSWRLDHGAPLFNISGLEPLPLLETLETGGWIEPWTGTIGRLDSQGNFQLKVSAPLTEGFLYRGCGGSDGLCRGLLATARGLIDSHYGVLVRRLERTADGQWQLFGALGEQLAVVNWLLLSGTLLAHPRSVAVMGWSDIPLRQAADADPALGQALEAIATLSYVPRSNLLLRFEAEAALAWRALPFQLLQFADSPQRHWGWQRLSIQPLPDGRCGVVLHTDATVSDGQDQAWIQQQYHRLMETLAIWLGPAPLPAADRSLMRWRAAFPLPPGLDIATMLCPSSQIAFCGDGVAGPGQGRVEGALRSGLALCEQLLG
ncbi:MULTISPECIES: NAD(P)-binding protein [Synechococcaceae]|uniref:NAD(P)-binding protein n=1 Tax=Synechococcaceae TaxID=1890426 RepID=UPI002880181F|nr:MULTISPECIES: NAD(P)-binding protein [Synechococcaceae]